MKLLTVNSVIFIALLISACPSMPTDPHGSVQRPHDGRIIVATAAPSDLFVPMEPIAYDEFFEEELTYFDEDEDGDISRDEELFSFPNEAVQVRIMQFDAKGKASFAVAAVSVAGGHYQVIVDYSKFRMDLGENFVYQSGVGFRMRANIVTFEAGIDISSLFGLGFAAQQKKLSGTLRFETIGISGRHVSSMLPLPSEISVQSIQTAMQAGAAIKASLYDEEQTQIYPQVFAFKKVHEQPRSESDD